MTSRCITLPVAGLGPAMLTLPDLVTPRDVALLGDALSATLRALRLEVEPTFQDPGSIEVDSWMPARH